LPFGVAYFQSKPYGNGWWSMMISLANSGWLMMKWRYNDECWIINHPEFAKEIINEIIIMVSFIHQCWINVVDHQCWLSAVILAGTGHILAIERCTSTVRFSEGSPAKAFIAERQKEFQRPVDGRWVLQYPVDPMVPVQWVNHQHQQVTKKHIRRLSRLFRVCWFVCLFVVDFISILLCDGHILQGLFAQII
jgi:hypothetical protein